jgi:hypothetical protein
MISGFIGFTLDNETPILYWFCSPRADATRRAGTGTMNVELVRGWQSLGRKGGTYHE